MSLEHNEMVHLRWTIWTRLLELKNMRIYARNRFDFQTHFSLILVFLSKNS